jgi:hypothetical protein
VANVVRGERRTKDCDFMRVFSAPQFKNQVQAVGPPGELLLKSKDRAGGARRPPAA